MPRSIDSLDSRSSYDPDDDLDIAQEEWEESLNQLVQVVSLVLFPYLGKWLGRRCSYWAYARYLKFGLGKSFLLGQEPLPSSAM
ncbi:hypothetical protein EVG20_g1566 [Dentipellis fragilis]|uniref:Uncharacterized protein n=1 Tax=Dentipellis fragilis TaxID=205917 RepID=A0A4Y9ZC99_9AGAM|nr:hypothetical protein EVG20_g1566 [Dentipellis fragilis]